MKSALRCIIPYFSMSTTTTGGHWRGKCSVVGCQSGASYPYGTAKPKQVLHKVPYQPVERRQEWLALIGRLDLMDKNTRALVCTKHFSDAQYSSTLRTRLNVNAAPELYLPDPKGEKDENGDIKIVHMPRVYEPSNFWYEPGDSTSCYKTICLPLDEDRRVGCPEITVLPTQRKPEPPVISLEHVKCEPMEVIDMPSNNAETIPDLNNVPETDSSVLYDIGYMDIVPKCELAEIDDHSALKTSPVLQEAGRTFTNKV
ncbi:hypothetical protein B566_EDAN010458 [Ephemera danica]|nr:hypothetical protein B566_EDAN010458 [Ephemera danica]